ncbi:hypothetical protein EON80_15270 [bacterium]|nr:MAG: hypothetical protein EON80_15270 [bacterium]
MKTAPVLATAALVVTAVQTLAAPSGWKKYTGPWFSVSTPPAWKAAPKKLLPSEDSAIFTSPDGQARFSVYSPIWNGDPPLIKRDTKTEAEVGRRVSVTKGPHSSTIRVTWLTFKSTDGRWTRSVVDRENVTLNTRLTFGFAYRDQKTYNRYQKTYETFKNSLVQYSD